MPRSRAVTAKEHRKHIPMGVKVKACLLIMGFSEADIVAGVIDFDHFPALGLRPVDPETGKMTPDPNDFRYIQPLLKPDHKVKTSGRRGEKLVTTANADQGKIAKVERIVKQREEAARRLLAKSAGEPKPRSKWGKRPLSSKSKRGAR